MQAEPPLPRLATLLPDHSLRCLVCLQVSPDHKLFYRHLRAKRHLSALQVPDPDTNLAYSLQQNNHVSNQQLSASLKRKAQVHVEDIEPLFNYKVDKKQKTYRIVEEYVTFVDEEEQEQPEEPQEPTLAEEEPEKKSMPSVIDDDQAQLSVLHKTIQRMKEKQFLDNQTEQP